jgi:hypothetical protein
VPGLPEVAGLARPLQETYVSAVQFFQEMGGLTGRFLLAFLAIRIVGRRFLLRIFQIPGLIVFPFVFFYAANHSVDMLKWGIALAGALTIAQFSFWGNYLPRVYPTHLRGTGESFAANIGGRMIGTSAAFITAQSRTTPRAPRPPPNSPGPPAWWPSRSMSSASSPVSGSRNPRPNCPINPCPRA